MPEKPEVKKAVDKDVVTTATFSDSAIAGKAQLLDTEATIKTY